MKLPLLFVHSHTPRLLLSIIGHCYADHLTLLIARKMCQRRRVFLPVLAIKDIDLQGFNIGALNTAQINAEAILIRARGIEGFNAADLTESMFRTASIKCVSGD